MVTTDNLIGLVPIKLQLHCVHVDEKVIAGSRDDIGGFESDRAGAVMSQVFSKQLWKQTLSKVIQVRECNTAVVFVAVSFEGCLPF